MILEELKEVDERQKLSIPAKRLMEKLSPIHNKPEEMSKRWFWELVQNASDFNDSVKIKLVITDEFVQFHHNGKPFSSVDVLNIISPDSNKDTETKDNTKGKKSSNIGKFGSGLISTHFLSSNMIVDGLLLSSKDNGYYNFSFNLDRSGFTNKEALIDSQKRSREQLEASLKPAEHIFGEFETCFTYPFSASFGDIRAKDYMPLSIKYILETLPYVMAFMPKVNQIEISNESSFFDRFKNFSISPKQTLGDKLILETDKDGEIEETTLLHLTWQSVSTSVVLEGNTAKPFHKDLSKLFCGLPLIGAEKVGLPFVINSLNFVPTTEREAVSLSPYDKENRSLMDDGVKLYEILLKKLIELKIENLYDFIKVRKQYNGSEASQNRFKEICSKYIKVISDYAIIKNCKGDLIKINEAKIPAAPNNRELTVSETKEVYYSIVASYYPNDSPELDKIDQWAEAINFNYFKDVAYTLDMFLNDLGNTKSLDNIILYQQRDLFEWLEQLIELCQQVDSSLFVRYAILPNRANLFQKQHEKLFYAFDLPEELLKIYDGLGGEDYKSLLLHKNLNKYHYLLGVGKEKKVQDLALEVDALIKEKYKQNNGSTTTFVHILKDLLSWYQAQEETEELKIMFPWFSEKRAVLFLDTFNERERNAALEIAQSGKMEALSELAKSAITEEEIIALSRKAGSIRKILEMLHDTVDDETYANIETGNAGEELVYKDLLNKYPTYQGYKVLWASKEKNEARYDFEIKDKTDKTILYVDAKSTTRGMNNSDSIPFFMRKSQWVFLNKLDDSTPYLLARVFMADQTIKYLQIKKK